MDSNLENVDNLVAGNAGSRYVSMAVTMLLGFVLTPFLIHSIGKAAYGLQSLSHQALEFITMATAAVGISYDRLAATLYARGEIKRMNATLSAGLALSVSGAVIVLAGTAVLASLAGFLFDLPPAMVPTARWVLAICGVGAACHIVNTVFRSPVFITKRLYLEAFGSVIGGVSAAALVVPLFLLTGPSIVTWVALSIGTRVLSQWFFTIPMARKGFDELHIRLFAPGYRAEMRKLLSFSSLTLIGSVGNLLYFATDSIMIANLDALGITQVANYNVAQRWYPQVLMLATGFVGVLGPVMTEHAAMGRLDHLRKTVVGAVRHTYVILTPPCLLLVLYARPFLEHWLKRAFVPQSVPVMQLVMGGLLLSGIGFVSIETLYACRRIKGVVVATLIGGALNVVLSIGLVVYGGLGLTGIALGSVVSLLLLGVFCAPYFLFRRLELRPWEPLRGALRGLAGAPPLAVAAWLLQRWWAPGSLGAVFVHFALCSLVYAAAAWGLAMTPGDRAGMLKAVRSGLAYWRKRRERGKGDA